MESGFQSRSTRFEAGSPRCQPGRMPRGRESHAGRRQVSSLFAREGYTAVLYARWHLAVTARYLSRCQTNAFVIKKNRHLSRDGCVAYPDARIVDRGLVDRVISPLRDHRRRTVIQSSFTERRLSPHSSSPRCNYVNFFSVGAICIIFRCHELTFVHGWKRSKLQIPEPHAPRRS